MMKRLTIIILSSIITMVGALFAQEGEGGTESNLSKGFGSRAFGLGSAFTALADDPTAVYWNPAGLEYVYQQSLTLFHYTPIEGASYDFLGYAYPTLNVGTFGIGIGRIGIGGITQRDLFGNELGSFSFAEYQGFLSYAKRLPWNITPGLSIRVLRRGFSNLVEEGKPTDYGVGLDLGFMYRPELFTSALLQNWSFGLSVRNLFTPQIKERTTIDELPLSVRFGVMKRVINLGGQNNFNILFDVDYSEKRSMRFNMGTEYAFQDIADVRIGFNDNGLALGAGVRYSIFQIDYAFGQSEFSDVFPALHRFSLSFNFGLTRDELYTIAENQRKAEEKRIIAEIREADKEQAIANHLQKGREYFESGEYLDAIVEYQQVIGEEPFHSEAQAMLDSAETLLQKELDTQQARAIEDTLSKRQAESNRDFIQTHFERGKLNLDQNQFTEALIEFNMALERDSDNETILSAIETTKRRMNEEVNRLIQQAREEFQNQNYSEALRLLGNAQLIGGENEAIQSEITALTQRIKLTENIQEGLGYYDIGQYERALDVFEKALEIDPDNELVQQYYERSKVETTGKQEKMDAAAEQQYLKGVDKFLAGNYREAIRIWEKILEKYPYNKKVRKAIEGAQERLNEAN
ncbi:MAG: PorV/PorQ family protein [Caldithrix sp.]|nr:PorV/PorQ family protein [Caldithrix sp.]